jgi:protoporphyrinogen oxidase
MTIGSAIDKGHVAIVGGGLLGLTTAYRLTQAGVSVTVYERAPVLGGLAATTNLDGIPVDRFYHVVLPTDDRVIGLAEDLGIGKDRFRFQRTGVGFYQHGELTSMSTLKEFATFPGLRAVDRARLAGFVARCQLKRRYDDLEQIQLEEWLRKTCGRKLWDDLWQPLLDSKFDGRYDDLPATYLWARSRRMSGTRDRSASEVMGTIDGGYQVLVDALAAAIRAGGGAIRTSTEVTSIVSSRGSAVGVVTPAGLHTADQVVSTLLPVHTEPLLSPELKLAVGPDPLRYLGVVCLVMRVRKSNSPYYSVNITDRRIPLTTVVETTHVVDPERVGGTLIYAPKYVNSDSPELERSAPDIRRSYIEHVQTLFPALREEDVLATQVARARVAEPVHVLGARRDHNIFPATGLAVASTAHVYPELVNGQAVLGVAERLVDGLLERLEQRLPEAQEAA